MLQSSHDDTVERVLWQLEAGVLLQALDVDEGTHKLSVQQSLVGQPLNVLGSMGIDVLQRARQLVIEPLDERYHAAGDAEDLARVDWGQLVVVLPLFGVLDDDNLLCVLEDLQKLAEFLVGPGLLVSTVWAW
jgi:hypothetical protein